MDSKGQRLKRPKAAKPKGQRPLGPDKERNKFSISEKPKMDQLCEGQPNLLQVELRPGKKVLYAF